MTDDTFKAFRVEKTDTGVTQCIAEQRQDDLPPGEVLIRVKYSSVNYKDAMSAKGLPGVTKNYPHTPGIDAAGRVVNSTEKTLKAGDEVIVTGFDLGMNTPGGYGEYIRVPATWVTPLPAGMTLRESMIIGTAGLTAALCLGKLLHQGAQPDDGPLLVTGATGGVGSVAVALLAQQGFTVLACTGKADKRDYLKQLGASDILPRASLSEVNERPLGKMAWAHGIDTVGGEILSNLVKGLAYGGSVAICGLVASPTMHLTVLPFLLRGVNMLGIDSVELDIKEKTRVWNKLATDWQLDCLEKMVLEIQLSALGQAIDSIFAGKTSGRTLLVHDD